MGKDDEIKVNGGAWRGFLSWINTVDFTQNRYDRKWVKGGLGMCEIPAFSEQLEEGEEEELRDNTHAHQVLSRLLGQAVEPLKGRLLHPDRCLLDCACNKIKPRTNPAELLKKVIELFKDVPYLARTSFP